MHKFIPFLLILAIAAPLQAVAEKAAAPARSDVVASYGDIELTVGEVEDEVVLVKRQKKIQALPDSKILNLLVEEMLVRKALAAEARQAGLENNPSVRHELEAAALKILSRARMAQRVDAEPEPDYTALAKEIYLGESSRFETPEKAMASHILILTGDKHHADEEALKMIGEIEKEVKADPSRFEEIAKERSEDKGSAKKGGSIGWVEKEKLVKPFAEALFAMKEEQSISGPVKSKFGYHLIRNEERKPATKKSFDEVKDELIAEAKKNQRTELIRNNYATIRDSKKFAADEQTIDRLYKAKYAEKQE